MILRAMHLLAAVVWAGGMIFFTLVIMPALRQGLSPPQQQGLIRELSKRGYRVATIKHTHHAVDPDQPGKDSWRHRKAGAKVSVLSSPKAMAVFTEVEQELTVDELYRRFIQPASGGVDLVLAEGYKDSHYPKIVVIHDESWNGKDWTGVRAVVYNSPVQVDPRLDPGVPIFKPGDIQGICRFLESEFLNGQKKRKV